MTNYQRTVLLKLNTGRPYAEIAKALKIQPQSLYNAIWRFRQKGIDVTKRPKPKTLTPTQRKVLELYSQKMPIAEIAKRLGIAAQTVWNHAHCGFRRLSLVTPGVDRVAAIPAALAELDAPEGGTEQKPVEQITMEDPFFN